MDNSSKVLCTCSKCCGFTVFNDGQEYSGRFLRPKTVRQHKQDDLWAQRVRDEGQEGQEENREISSAVLLAAASDPPSTGQSSALPVRCGDTLNEDRGVHPTSFGNNPVSHRTSQARGAPDYWW